MTDALSAREYQANGAGPAASADIDGDRAGGMLFELFATSLDEESERFRERLRDVRARLSAHGEWLAAREAQVTEDELQLRARDKALQTREDQLEQRQRELESLGSEVHKAQGRRDEANAEEPGGLLHELSGGSLLVLVAVGLLLLVTVPRLGRARRGRRVH